MNNLKFRAWDKKLQILGKVSNIDFDFEEVMFYIDDEEELDVSQTFKDVEIMQSTGLFDKNGVEIFEGDIIRTYGNDYTPIYSKGIYMALNVSQIKLPKENWSFSTQFNIVWRDGGEVIGNIYENKELLGND